MGFRTIGVDLVLRGGPYEQGLAKAMSQTRTFAQQVNTAGKEAEVGFAKAATGAEKAATATQKAEANIAALARRNTDLKALAAEYQRIATTAEKGSEQQIAAARLAEVANKKLEASERAAAQAAEQAAGSVQGMAGGAAQSLGRVTSVLDRLSSAGVPGVGALSSALGKVAAQSTGLAGGLGTAEAAVEGLGTKGSGALSSLGLAGLSSGQAIGAGVAAGAGAGLLALAGLARSGVDQLTTVGAETRKLKAALGSSAEDASRLRNVAVGLGVDTDALSKGIFKLSVNLDKTKGDFAGVHVEIARNRDGTADLFHTVDNLRAAYQSIQDPQQRNIFLQEALSKGGIELRGVVSATADEYERLKRSGPILSQQDLDRTRELAIAHREAGVAVQKLEIDLARGLLPTLITVEHGISGVVNAADKLTGPIGGIGGAVEKFFSIAAAATPLGLFKNHVKDSNLELHGWAGTVEDIASRTIPPFGLALDLLGHKHKETTDAAGDLKDKLQQEQQAIADQEQALRDAADAGHLNVAATKDLTDANRAGVAAFKEFKNETVDARVELDKMKDAAGGLSDKLDKLLGGSVSVDKATIGYEESLAALTRGLGENGRSLDLHTEAGRKNVKAIDDVVSGIHDHIDALIKSGASTDEVRGKFNAHIEDLKRVLKQMGFNEGEIDTLITKYGLVPETVDTAVRLLQTQEAIATAEATANAIAAKFKIAQDSANIVVSLLGVETAEARLAALRQDAAGNIFKNVPQGSVSDPSVPSGEVTYERNAEGGVVRAFADGGLQTRLTQFANGAENHVAQIAQGQWPVRVWAEPETDWEAYIPGAASKRGRSKAIVEDVVHRFGGDVQWGANHKIEMFAYGGRLEDDPNYRPGMTDTELAALTEAQPFGEANISASGGYHAFTAPSGERYYSPREGFYDDARTQPVPGYEGRDRAVSMGWDRMVMERPQMAAQSLRIDYDRLAEAIVRSVPRGDSINVGPIQVVTEDGERAEAALPRLIREELIHTGRW